MKGRQTTITAEATAAAETVEKVALARRKRPATVAISAFGWVAWPLGWCYVCIFEELSVIFVFESIFNVL